MGVFLDVATLLIATALAGLCISISLFLIWRSERTEIFVFDWSLSYGLATVTMLLASVRGRLPEIAATVLPGASLLACFGVLWLGYRRFAGRAGRFDRALACAGVIGWCLFVLAGRGAANINVREVVNTSIELAYIFAIIYELNRHQRGNPQSATVLTIGLFVIHAAKLLVVMMVSLSGAIDAHVIAMPNTLYFGLSFVESSLFSVFLGLLQLVLIGQRLQQRYRHAAETDSLTGLANRRHFLDCLLPRLARGRGALTIFDIDHFKRVNDTFGHPAGDWALCAFAAILSDEAPAECIAARIGGEEFALFLPEATVGMAIEIADRVRHRLADLRMPTAVGELRVTVSCGVADVGEAEADYQALHCAADKALYAAKNGGRNRVVAYRRSPIERSERPDACDAPAGTAVLRAL